MVVKTHIRYRLVLICDMRYRSLRCSDTGIQGSRAQATLDAQHLLNIRFVIRLRSSLYMLCVCSSGYICVPSSACLVRRSLLGSLPLGDSHPVTTGGICVFFDRLLVPIDRTYQKNVKSQGGWERTVM